MSQVHANRSHERQYQQVQQLRQLELLQKQQQQQRETMQQRQLSPAAAAALSKAKRLLYSTIMDYKHVAPTDVADCLHKLQRLLGNIVDHTSDKHFRRVKATNKAFANHIANVHGAIELLVELGWRTKVVEFERSWVFEHGEGSDEFEVLRALVEELGRALQAVDDKAKKFTARVEDPHAEERALRARLLAEIEADKKERHDRFVYTQ